MPKKTDDPALDRAVRVFWVVTIPAMLVVMALNIVWGDPFASPAQRFSLAFFVGISLSLFVGTVVYIAGERHLRAEKRRKIQEQKQDVRRRADNNVQLGPRYASIVETSIATVRHDIRDSEAARGGLLGDIDFDADIRGITDNLRKAHELQKVADKLASLEKPSADDRNILAEAKATVAKLENNALSRVELIAKCATEAQLIDKSLRDERQDAKTSAERAELHAKLAAMLYGIEATSDTTPTDSAADAVLLRVRAYREIKNQIRLVRD